MAASQLPGQDSPYDGPNRRVGQRRDVSREEIADMVAEEMDAMLANSQSGILLHFDTKTAQIQQSNKAIVEETVKKAVAEAFDKFIEEAFPDRKLYKHKEFHEGLIRAANDKAKIRLDLLTWGYRGLIIFVLGVMAMGAKEWLIREVAK